MTTERILKAAQEKYEVFHIFIDSRARELVKLLPGRTILIQREDIDALPEIIISAIQISQGKNLNDVLAQWNDMRRPIVQKAVWDLARGNNKEGLSF